MVFVSQIGLGLVPELCYITAVVQGTLVVTSRTVLQVGSDCWGSFG